MNFSRLTTPSTGSFHSFQVSYSFPFSIASPSLPVLPFFFPFLCRWSYTMLGRYVDKYIGSSNGISRLDDKGVDQRLEIIHTNERIGSHRNYYERDDLRTEDGLDHIGVHHKVGHIFRSACSTLSTISDERKIIHGSNCNGVSMDWLANTRISLWRHHSQHIL